MSHPAKGTVEFICDKLDSSLCGMTHISALFCMPGKLARRDILRFAAFGGSHDVEHRSGRIDEQIIGNTAHTSKRTCDLACGGLLLSSAYRAPEAHNPEIRIDSNRQAPRSPIPPQRVCRIRRPGVLSHPGILC